jgi:lipopolysaccharide-assembly LptC-related protein
VTRLNWRPPAVVAVLAFLAWVGFEIGRAGSEIAVPRMPTNDQIVGGTIHGQRIDKRAWSLDFDTASVSPDGSQATIAHVRDGRIHRPGKPDVTMTADGVTVNRVSNDFTVTGPVTFVEPEPGGRIRRFTTVGAHYQGATRMLELDHTATITEGTTKVVVSKATVDFRTGDVKVGPLEGTRS